MRRSLKSHDPSFHFKKLVKKATGNYRQRGNNKGRVEVDDIGKKNNRRKLN